MYYTSLMDSLLVLKKQTVNCIQCILIPTFLMWHYVSCGCIVGPYYNWRHSKNYNDFLCDVSSTVTTTLLFLLKNYLIMCLHL